MSHTRHSLLSQGEARPGVVQGQLWRTIRPMKRYVDGPNGDRVTLHINAWETIDMVTLIASCYSCGADLGTTDNLKDQKDLMNRHFETCRDYLDGEGLKKERPIAWRIVEDS